MSFCYKFSGVKIKRLFQLKAFILTPFFFFLFNTIYSQSPDSTGYYLIDVKKHLDKKEYSLALEDIRNIFSESTEISDEVTFLYGKTMLGLKKYVLARNALSNYIDGGDNVYYNEAVTLLSEAKKNICSLCDNTGTKKVETKCVKCSGAGKISTNCNKCDKKGQLLCKVCDGKGVIVENNNMKKTFKDCPVCSRKGYKICPSCNGTLRVNVDCDICHGHGMTESNRECIH